MSGRSFEEAMQEARDKIAAAAQAALKKEKAQNLIGETGVLIYWQDADASKAQIESDAAAIGKISEINEQ